MGEINALFIPTAKVVHEDWDLQLRMTRDRLREPCYAEGCRQTLQSYLEVAFDPLEVPESPGQAGAGQRQLGTISRWVENLVMQQSDLDRGEMVDKLIKYDEQRLLAAEQESVPESLFSHGRTIHIVLSRLDLASHYSLHERRTPIRTHLLKFLLNVLSRNDTGRISSRDPSVVVMTLSGSSEDFAANKSKLATHSYTILLGNRSHFQAERLAQGSGARPMLRPPMGVRPPIGGMCPGGGMGGCLTGCLGPAMGGLWSPAPRRPIHPAEPHNDWNSDDEEIDEFGRKKRRKVAKPCRQPKAM
eukprot:s565_g16.t1